MATKVKSGEADIQETSQAEATSSGRDDLGEIPLSASASSVARGFSPTERVRSWAIVKALLANHPEYGQGLGGKLANAEGPTQGESRTTAEWFGQAYALYEPKKIQVLDGRLTIYGLSQLDPFLQSYLGSEQFLDSLNRDRDTKNEPPFETLLRPASTTKPEPTPAPPPAPGIPDPAVMVSDSPTQEDQLGRQGFTEALAIWLTRFWNNQNGNSEARSHGQSFALHIHGPWGSGKTSLLNLLQRCLQTTPTTTPSGDPADGETGKWVVVKFNAWQQQHLDPVWWPLLDRVYRDSVHQLKPAFNLRLWEKWWRFRTGHGPSLFALFISLLTLLGLLVWINVSKSKATADAIQGVGDAAKTVTTTDALQLLGDTAKSVAAILALLGTVGSAVLLFSRSLFSGSASSAQAFVQFAPDPMEKVRRHFQDLVTHINRPIIIFIDDLDRCKTEYVVGLLEGIQTLFNDSRVFYVIAADRRWLTVCFETEYQKFTSAIQEPGRKMGYLFLEKAFQISVSIPRIPPEVRQSYLDFLIQGKRPDAEQKLIRLRQDADADFQNATNIEEIVAKLQEPSTSVLNQQIRREAAVRQSANSRVEAATTYFLQGFSLLLEPNPRAMKRLVTAYGIYRALAILTDISLVENLDKRKQLALWTIVLLRWPLLAEYLEKYPDKADLLSGAQTGPMQDTAIDELRPLFENEDVKRVFQGDGDFPRLDKEAIIRLIGIKATHATAAMMA